MTRFVEDLAFVFLGCSQELEHGKLRGLIREIIVIAAVQHENGDTDPGYEMKRINLRFLFLESESRNI